MNLRIAVCLVVLFTQCHPAAASSAERDRHNAATYYQRAIDRLGTLTERERELLRDYEGPTVAPSPGWLWTSMGPPLCVTIPSTDESPSPVPFPTPLVV